MHGHTNTNDADLVAPHLLHLLIAPSQVHDRPEAGPSSKSTGTAHLSPNEETAGLISKSSHCIHSSLKQLLYSIVSHQFVDSQYTYRHGPQDPV